MMRIRPFRTRDTEQLAGIFRAAVLHSGAQAYSPAQLEAWAGAADDVKGFGEELARGVTLVAETDQGETVAFGQLAPEDRVSLLYTAPGFARASYASGIYRMLEDRARVAGVTALHTEASRVARPFFEKQGFELIETEHVRRRGVTFERFRMTKVLEQPAAASA